MRTGKEGDNSKLSGFQIAKTVEKKKGEEEAFNRQIELLLESYIKTLVGGDDEYKVFVSNGGVPRHIIQKAEEVVGELRDQLGSNLPDVSGVVSVGRHSLKP